MAFRSKSKSNDVNSMVGKSDVTISLVVIAVLGEPSGKFDFYVLYPRKKTPQTPLSSCKEAAYPEMVSRSDISICLVVIASGY